MEEYATSTWRDDSYTKKFIKACKTVMELADVKEVYDRKEAKRIKEKRERIHNCIEALTKDMPEGSRIDVPIEFKEKEILYT